MATKTISLSEDAYNRLKDMKEEGESFSDVVRKISKNVDLNKYHGVLSEETADKVEKSIQESRDRTRKKMKERSDRIKEDLE